MNKWKKEAWLFPIFLCIIAVPRQKEASHIKIMKKIEVKHLKLRRGSIFITFARTCFLLHFRWVLCVCHICMYWTPRLSLGHPGSFRSAHILKCMCTQTGPRFNVPSERRSTTTWVVHPYPISTMPARAIVEPGTFWLGVEYSIKYWAEVDADLILKIKWKCRCTLNVKK